MHPKVINDPGALLRRTSLIEMITALITGLARDKK
ncbi:hypothetical protein BH23CYA1_BH23CYA1_22910 [soil metagenome]